MNVFEMIFSPTGGTARVARALTQDWMLPVTKIDLTSPVTDFGGLSIGKEDLCVIAVPSYGGRVPATAAARIACLKGHGALAVLVAVYGNREIDDTLVELQDLAEAADFRVIAGISAVAEHSILRQFAAGRPDAEDCAQLKHFADQIMIIAKRDYLSAPTLPGHRPYQEFPGMATKPTVNDNCDACGLCSTVCPVGAIPATDPATIDANACITCMRCVSICPNRARRLPEEVLNGLNQKLAPLCSERKPNKLYL